MTRLRLSAWDCSFDKADEMIRDRIVFGTSSPQIRAKLINVGAELTLEKAIQIAQSWEYSQAQLRAMGGATAQQEVHIVRRQGNSDRTFGDEHARRRTDSQGANHLQTTVATVVQVTIKVELWTVQRRERSVTLVES